MAQAKVRMTTFKHLADKGDLGVVLVRLMMFINDLTLCNDSMEQWHKFKDAAHRSRESGAKMYFSRLMIAHMFEALKVINKINTTPDLKKAVEQCETTTQDAFTNVAKVIGTNDYKLMKQVRDSITFHYLHDNVESALATLAKTHPNDPRPISIGTRTIDWHYEPSDRIIDNAVLREIFKVAEGADLKAELETYIELYLTIGDDLAAFAGPFIFHHAGKS
jgi:hypothetical protein